MARSAVFVLPSEAAGRKILRELQSQFDGRSRPASGYSTTFFDTFDWRLRRRGDALSVDSDSNASVLCWRDEDGRLRHRLPAAEPPEFAWDLPRGPLRDALSERIAMRRLLRQVVVDGSSRVFDCLDGRGKTVARIRLERAVAATHGGEPRRLRTVIVVESLRGYEPSSRKIVRWLEGQELRPAATSALDRAFDALELSAEGAPRRPVLPAGVAIGEALRRILTWLLAVMRHNEDGVIRDLDTEFLHDYRVAVRRTRSVLTLFKRSLAESDGRRFRDEFAWLGGVTGPQRDLDVFLLGLPELGAILGDAAALDPLEAFLRRRQRAAQQVAEALRGERYRGLLVDWAEFIDRLSAGAAEQAARPASEIAGRRIWRAWRRVRDDGRGIDEGTPAEALHRLRIDGKKLRYLLEFFETLYPKQTVGPMIRSLKKLQETLGDFNDREVQQESLARFAEQMREEGEVPQATMLAIGRLIEHLRDQQRRERRRFAERFARFDSTDQRASARRLFRKGGVAAP